jgi:hypothetical protein
MENLCIFYDHLVYFMTVGNSLWPLGIFHPHFGILYQEKSGNPALYCRFWRDPLLSLFFCLKMASSSFQGFTNGHSNAENSEGPRFSKIIFKSTLPDLIYKWISFSSSAFEESF